LCLALRRNTTHHDLEAKIDLKGSRPWLTIFFAWRKRDLAFPHAMEICKTLHNFFSSATRIPLVLGLAFSVRRERERERKSVSKTVRSYDGK